MKIIVTGGAGFIGSALIRHLINKTNHSVTNIDKLTYAGNLDSLRTIENNTRYSFEQVDICDSKRVQDIFLKHCPDIVFHLAAESHVDRSIENPMDFIQTNIIGTYILLEESRLYWENLEDTKKKSFRFHHISTDEVFGDLKNSNELFSEDTSYDPSSPYSASKASSDHLVRAWFKTYELPILITNCSNNYGPYQYPEKLIPLVINNALTGKPIPVYGKGDQIRDWLYVEDHAEALLDVAINAKIGETYNIGGHNEVTNIEVINVICNILDELNPSQIDGIKKYSELITHVEDRAGHDFRYAINADKIKHELGWSPHETFQSGLRKTVEWYLANKSWSKKIINKSYREDRFKEITS